MSNCVTYHCVVLLFAIKMLKWVCGCGCVCVHAWMSLLLAFSVVLFLFRFVFPLFCYVLFGMWFCTNGKPFIVTFTYHFDNEVKVKAKVKAYGSLRKTWYLLVTKFNIHTYFMYIVHTADRPKMIVYDSMILFTLYILLWNTQSTLWIFVIHFFFPIFRLAYIHDKHTKCIVI